MGKKGRIDFCLIFSHPRPMSKLTDLAPADLAGWWLVDALDGRRWIGRLLSRGPQSCDPDPPLLDDEIVLSPAFEVPPDRVLAAVQTVQMQMNPRTMEMEPTPAISAVPLTSMQVACLLNVGKNGLQWHRIRRCSMTRLSDWMPKNRADLRKGILACLELAESKQDDAKPSLIEASGR
jgi:hypothetical protein